MISENDMSYLFSFLILDGRAVFDSRAAVGTSHFTADVLLRYIALHRWFLFRKSALLVELQLSG